MAVLEAVRIALRTLLANKGRATLTMLGVAIGVAAVIALVSIGVGVQAAVGAQIEGLGSNLLFVFPGSQGPQTSFGGLTRLFTLDDVRMLQQQLTGVTTVVPVLQASAPARAGDRTMQTRIAASTGDAVQVFTAHVAAGRHYGNSETDSAARVVALGSTVRRTLFPNQDPIGREMTLDGQRFTVTGYYLAQGGGFGGDLDNQVYIPVTTAQRLLGRSDIDYIVVKVTRAQDIPAVRAEVTRLMARRYRDQFTVFSQEQTLGVFNNVVGTLTYMLAGIAAISLVVGGIGIMNIMLVSVTERTREIGIRKAVGGREWQILAQFIAEAVLLSLIGGLQGVVLGAIAATVLSRWVPTQLTWWATLLAFGSAAVVGVFFGVYPAYKASRLDPIEALRYE